MKRLLFGFLVVWFCLFIVNIATAGAEVRLFGTLGYGYGATSTLVELNPDTGAIIQTIGPVGYLVNGLDYDPTTGTLYGGTSYSDAFNGLIEIDMTTGAGTPVGAANWGMGYQLAITNITVDSAGQMYGWSEWTDSLVRIDKSTGVAVDVGWSGIGTAQYGLSFNASDVLYLVNYDASFYSVNTTSGVATYEGNVGTSTHHGDFHPLTDLYYGLTWNYGEPRTLLRCDLGTQSYTVVGEVGNLHTLAFVFDTTGCIESFISRGTIYDKNEPWQDTITIDQLTGCTGLAEAVVDLPSKVVHIEAGPLSVDIPGDRFILQRAGYYEYYKPTQPGSRETQKVRIFPDAENIFLWFGNTNVNGITNPITIKVEIGDMCWEATDEWREYPYSAGVKFMLP